MPRSFGTSGRLCSASPSSHSSAMPRPGAGPSSSLSSSSRTRSRLIEASAGAAARIALGRCGFDLERQTRRRTAPPAAGAAGPPANRSRGSPTARTTCRSRSPRPSNGSCSVPSRGSSAIALIVKSRRARSSARWRLNDDGRLARARLVRFRAVGGDFDVLAAKDRADGAELLANLEHPPAAERKARSDPSGVALVAKSRSLAVGCAEQRVAHDAADQVQLGRPAPRTLRPAAR